MPPKNTTKQQKSIKQGQAQEMLTHLLDEPSNFGEIE